MIFYFSGTGNSYWVAKELGGLLSERLVSITAQLKKGQSKIEFKARDKERVIFVYPVHSWGPALPVAEFINDLDLTGASGVWSVSVCGDDCGYTNRVMATLLEKKGLRLNGSYSVRMPNNYIFMKGFGVDKEEVVKRKLEAAPERVALIANAIKEERRDEKLYEAGSMPGLKTRLVYPLFKRFKTGKHDFHVKFHCTGCTLCRSVCPTNNIFILSNHPVWDNNCIECTACINQCPVNAIECGEVTENMGRYTHPILGQKKRIY